MGKLFVVSGPSGAGKSTLCRLLTKRTRVFLSTSATTRPRGKDEVDGQHYYFLSQEDFEARIRAQAFLEYARVFDHYYGTPAEPVARQRQNGTPVILEIDVQGAAKIFAQDTQAIGILVLPPNELILRQRLSQRGRDDQASMEKRLAKAQEEIRQAQAYDRYRYTIINENLEKALEDLTRIVTQ